MTALSVNVNKIAWLRNAREGSKPDLVECCGTIVNAGTNGLTVHPRPDQRHIRADDVLAIAKFLNGERAVEYNIEGNPDAGPEENGYPGFLELVNSVRPTQCTLVPDSSDQLTSDHGFDLTEARVLDKVAGHISQLKSQGIRVSIFLDPKEEQIRRAAESGTDRIELYTGPWVELTEAHGLESAPAEASLAEYRNAIELARTLQLGVNAGHDLNLANLRKFCSIGQVDEVSIGHALISDALDCGLRHTVQMYLEQLN